MFTLISDELAFAQWKWTFKGILKTKTKEDNSLSSSLSLTVNEPLRLFERTHEEGLDVFVVGDNSVVNDDELYKRKTGKHRYIHFGRNYNFNRK